MKAMGYFNLMEEGKDDNEATKVPVVYSIARRLAQKV